MRLELPARNVNRTVGTLLGSFVTRRYGADGLPPGTIDLTFRGSGGQSFGAFLPRGITLRLYGDSNDYLGKGLSGGVVAVRPAETAPFVAEHNVIAGNVIAYGATSGEIYLRGIVGERFCVRNSGATVVAEGAGDHALEYMTGGTAVILGPTGRNLGAGMSGGYGYVLDLDRSLVNGELVDLEPVAVDDAERLREIVEAHVAYTGSAVGAALLADWVAALGRFTAVVPRDFKRVLEATGRADGRGEDVDAAVMAAARRAARRRSRELGVPAGVSALPRWVCTTGPRAKIVCTLGPATDTPERARALVEAGMDVARLNFSHGEHADHGRRFHEVRPRPRRPGATSPCWPTCRARRSASAGSATARSSGPPASGSGSRSRTCVGTHDRVSTTYKNLADDVSPGDRLLVDDGNVALIAVDIENGTDVVCDVTEGGVVSDNKGLSLPGVDVSVPAMSDKDADDLEFALRLGVDFVALSFVRNPEDVKLVHRVMDEVGMRVPVIAKLEKPEAVDRLEEIVLAFDGMMVARGDLGVEMPLEQVPVVQKRAVQICRDNAKPVIVATQMLESMITHSRPTRAEASDVANAVIDGADAVMLSGETSVGKYPVQAVATMSRIIRSVEAVRHPGAPRCSTTRAPPAARSSRRPRTSATRSARSPWSRSPRPATPRGGCPGCSRRSGCWCSPRSSRCSGRWRCCGAPRRTWCGR